MSSFQLIALSDCCEIVSGATPSTSIDEYWDGDICWATPKDLSDLDGHYISDTPRKLTQEGLSSCAATVLPTNSVLFSSRAPIGHVAINTVPMATNQGFKSFIPKRNIIESKFLFHWLRANRTYLESLGNGATFKEVSKAVVGRVKIPVPPLPEQCRIAAILDQADALRAKRREALSQLDSLTQSIFIEMFGDPITNPKGWKILPVGDVTDCIVPGRDKPKSFSGETPWVTTEDLLHLDFTFSSSRKLGLSSAEISEVRARIIPSGSVVISCVGNLGLATIAATDMVINQQLHSYQCKKEINNVYLMHAVAMQNGYMYAKASSTTLPYMNKSVCNSIPVAIPPIDMQCSFSDRCMAINAQKTKHFSCLQELDSLFVSLQHRAFRGEL